MVLALRIAALGAAASLSAAAVAAPPAVTPHVAYYEMTLKSAGSTANVADVRGALVFDWSLACDAYVVEQQAAIQFFYDGGASESIGWTFRTTEAFDQSRYVFEMERTRGGSVSERITGEGAMAEAGGAVAFDSPDAPPVTLDADAMFPSRHTLALVEAAEAGRKLLSVPVFIGDEVGPPALLSAVIGPELDAPTDGDPMTRTKAWPVRLAFFEPDSPPDSGPAHEQDLVLQDDGIVRSLLLDYGDFVVRAELSRIEPGEREDC